jgi:hypothetical protein
MSRSHLPRGLRHEMPSLARTLRSWVRIPLKTWMSVCVYSVCVVLCSQSYRLSKIKKVKWNEEFHGCPMLQVGATETKHKINRIIDYRTIFTTESGIFNSYRNSVVYETRNSNLKMEAANLSQTLIYIYQTTVYHTSKGSNLQNNSILLT